MVSLRKHLPTGRPHHMGSQWARLTCAGHLPGAKSRSAQSVALDRTRFRPAAQPGSRVGGENPLALAGTCPPRSTAQLTDTHLPTPGWQTWGTSYCVGVVCQAERRESGEGSFTSLSAGLVSARRTAARPATRDAACRLDTSPMV